jgi:rRNA-processing protein FCF1
MEPKSEPVRGIFTGFEEYLQPTDDDYRAVLTAGLVVLDTNVLLNLYRYNVKVQDELVDLFARLGDRVWVPRQVLVEFWRNREAVLEESDRGAEAIVDEL